jgi:hypothetical protein
VKARRASDVSPANPGEPSHWLLRDQHRRHVERMTSGKVGAASFEPETAKGTRYLKSVFDPADSKNITKDGKFSPKVGRIVAKTAWKGRHMRMLTLEERATCPPVCDNWTTCYGNNMRWARRLRHGAELEARLAAEIAALRRPSVIRLHQLGDFYSLDYVRLWIDLVHRHDVVVFGYTAHPARSEIGAMISAAASNSWHRFAVRFSGRYQPESAPRAVTVRSVEEASSLGAIVCPAQIGKTPSCAQCGLCCTTKRTIAFLEH